MEWLVILGLGAWVWLQSRRIRTLTLELAELKRAAAVTRAAPAAGEDEPFLLTEVVREDELLLDAPLPPASNDEFEPAPTAFAWPSAPSTQEAATTFGVALILLAPALIDLDALAPGFITALVGGAAALGFAASAFRRWPWLALMTLTGLYLWFAFALGAGDIPRAIALLSFAGLGGAAMALRPPRPEDADGFGWSQVHATLPAIAIVASSVLAIWTWFDRSIDGVGLVRAPAILATGLVLLAALAVRLRAAAPAAFVVSTATLVIGFMAHLNARDGALGAAFYPLILMSAAALAGAAWIARPAPESRGLVAGASAAGAGLLAILAAFSRANWHDAEAFAPLFGIASLLFAAAWLHARESQDVKADPVIDAWATAGAALAMLGIESAFSEPIRVVAHAILALAFAAAYARLEWRALHFMAVFAAILALGHAIGPRLFILAADGPITLAAALALLAGAAFLFFAASRFAAHLAPLGATTETLVFAALLAPVIGVFYILHWASGAGILDAFVANALRAAVLLAAGLVMLPRDGALHGDVTRWRGHALLIAGLGFAFFWAGFALNPWWGDEDAAQVNGTALFNTQLLAFLAPAILAFAAAGRSYARDVEPARIYAVSGALLSLAWAVLELRRAFRGAEMAGPQLGVFEAACYGLLLITTALIIALMARVRGSKDRERPFTRDLIAVQRPIAWGALIGALVLMLALRHPWWGAQDAALTTASATGWGVMAQTAGVGLSLWLARILSISRRAEPTRFAAAATATILALSFGLSAVRWLYHRGRMDDGAALIGLEGLAYAVWPLLLVSAAAYVTARAPGRDTERAYLYDLQAIWATAIWPALAFAALGLWGLFNPWWGAWPVRASNIGGFLTILASFGLASCLSVVAARIPYVRARRLLARGGIAMGAAHFSIAAIILTRRIFHRDNMSTAPAATDELWIYVAVWAAIAITAFVVGTRRSNIGLRWFGIGLMALSITYAFALAFTRMNGSAQVGAILSIALTPFVAGWAIRAIKPQSRARRERDFKDLGPSARRDRGRARRYRSP